MNSFKPRVLLLIFLLSLVIAPVAYLLFHSIFLVPAAYYWWVIKQVAQVIPQAVYWILIISTLAMTVLFIEIRSVFRSRSTNTVPSSRNGPVAYMVNLIDHSKTSNYFGWVIANHLSKLALNITKLENESFERGDLEAFISDQKPPQDVANYLRAGFYQSFMAYGRRRWFFRDRINSPFDHKLEKVVTYLENLLEVEW
jgi:hypothetical protein